MTGTGCEVLIRSTIQGRTLTHLCLKDATIIVDHPLTGDMPVCSDHAGQMPYPTVRQLS